MRLAPLIAAAIGLSSPAFADEQWATIIGFFEWEESRGSTAVLRLIDEERQPSQMRLFLPGLVDDTMGPRGVYHGYWVDGDAEPLCPMQVVDDLGNKSGTWGRLVVDFNGGEFPSAWTAMYGYCFDDLYEVLNAEPAFGIGD